MGVWSKRGACLRIPIWSSIVYKYWSDNPGGNKPHILLDTYPIQYILVCIIRPMDKGWNKLYRPEGHLSSQWLDGRMLLTLFHEDQLDISVNRIQNLLQVIDQNFLQALVFTLCICWDVSNVWLGFSLSPKETRKNYQEGVNVSCFILRHLQAC